MTNLVALIPLRGGSKGIPGKNVKLLAGMPLCAWALTAAYNSGIFTRIIVSTDSSEIAQAVTSLGLRTDVLMRPPELATDTASTESVMLYIADQVEFDVLVTIQATSPLVRAMDFSNAWGQFQRDKLDTLLTGVLVNRFFWTKEGTPLNYNPMNRPRRQDFSGIIMENGAFYFTKREILLSTGCRLGGYIGVYEMQEDSAIEIDELSDWILVERILTERRDAEDKSQFNLI